MALSIKLQANGMEITPVWHKPALCQQGLEFILCLMESECVIISDNDSTTENEVQVFSGEILTGMQSCASLNW